ncbi:MAG: site-specific DNA-methyltransferase, partial [Nitrospira sp.]|nr:site-specific DNA-methyltransferase [Nitrospira sp.]
MAVKKEENLSKEKLLAEIERLKKELKKRKKYGLVWEEKPEDVAELCKIKLPVLKEVKSKEIITAPDKPVNLLIEGDNYHALSVLNYTHARKVDVIYIDPPYNTGKKDEFKFNDKWVDENDSYLHSKWLSFMEKRLRLGKSLLKDSGVIFVSIDDNELTQLRSLLDEIFDNNFIALFVHKNNSSKNQANLVSVSTEYLLLYKRTKDGLKGKGWRILKKGAKDIARMYEKLKAKGLPFEEIEDQIKEIYSRPKYMHLSRWNKVDERGVFVDADLSRESGPKDYTIINPNTKKPCVIPDRGWGKSYEELLRLQREDLIWYGDESTPPRMKVYITDENFMVPDSLLYFDNSIDTRMIKNMFGKLVFENPKPVELIRTIISMSSNKDAVILDFMAGSGTTGHAVLELNKEDKGNRQFILCTNNENNICTDVCYPRIEKVIHGYKNTKGEKVEGFSGNLKYFTTDFVDAEPTDKNKKKLTDQATEMLCIRENTYERILERKDFKIFKNSHHYTGIVFDQMAIPEFKEAIKEIKGKFSI